jgi:hypothetical protein
MATPWMDDSRHARHGLQHQIISLNRMRATGPALNIIVLAQTTKATEKDQSVVWSAWVAEETNLGGGVCSTSELSLKITHIVYNVSSHLSWGLGQDL